MISLHQGGNGVLCMLNKMIDALLRKATKIAFIMKLATKDYNVGLKSTEVHPRTTHETICHNKTLLKKKSK